MIAGRALLVLAALSSSAAASTAENEALASAAATEFELMAAAHQALRAYDVRIDVAYSAAGSAASFQARVACDGKQHCLRVFRNTTTLRTPGLSLMVNANDRTILVTTDDPAGDAAPKIDPAEALTTWIKAGGSLSGGELTPDGRRWAFQPAKPSIPAAQMYVDASSHLLRRLVYEAGTADKARSQVDIHYTWRDAARLDPAEFQTGRYIEEQDGTITPARDYANYRIIRTDRR